MDRLSIHEKLIYWPCPDPNFQPAPGQTLEEFLQEGAAAFIDLADNLSVTLDGQNMDTLHITLIADFCSEN